MKRRNSAPLTDEDCDIWLLRLRPLGMGWIRRMLDVDRLDADLMYQAQCHPLISGHITGSGEHVMLRSNLTSYRRAGIA